jgi:hypothetical protein
LAPRAGSVGVFLSRALLANQRSWSALDAAPSGYIPARKRASHRPLHAPHAMGLRMFGCWLHAPGDGRPIARPMPRNVVGISLQNGTMPSSTGMVAWTTLYPMRRLTVHKLAIALGASAVALVGVANGAPIATLDHAANDGNVTLVSGECGPLARRNSEGECRGIEVPGFRDRDRRKYRDRDRDRGEGYHRRREGRDGQRGPRREGEGDDE